jgi:hypothetical protein
MNYSELTKTNIKKLVHIYQLNYRNGKSPGLGDFLRGSFCFMQLAKLYNIDFDIDFSNHPMSKYLENVNKNEDIDYNNIEIYYDINLSRDKLIEYESSVKNKNINPEFIKNTIKWLNTKNSESVGFMSNAYPFFNKFTEEGKNFIKSKLEPNNVMKEYINYSLGELQLNKNGYGVIHIRTGDEHLVNNQGFTKEFLKKLKLIINSSILPDRRYLILSDSNILKNMLKTYPNFYILIRDIEHLGGEYMKNTDTNGIMNTLVDFYLMSYSKTIISLSTYRHVSGFSKYCSVIYGIPFKFIKI